MQTPLQLEIIGFKPSAYLKGVLKAHLDKLERQFGRSIACHVAIQAPNAHHRMGEPYRVTIWISLPNRRAISVKPPVKALDRRQCDLIFAVNDAFRRAHRQLHDEASRMKGRPATPEPRPI